ncbi:uncharacterized protein LOC114540214 [Dendronephthya gigantea]|uniref:uncharacterized protein LOC114540214 n=1 Tax=Dendronephthya gigantea TaxID=151771 RepID=UPI00106B9339|nr:uncharacterized protein LOC114540214 [Dendronephthya gigantea]
MALLSNMTAVVVCVITITTIGNLDLAQSRYTIDKTKVLKDQVLYGYAFRNLTMKTVDECFLACYEDCFCMSFQMCSQNTECQLLSSNQFRLPSDLLDMTGCSYYDMLPDLELIETGCNTRPFCRLQDGVCHNNAKYVIITPSDYTTRRFKCICPPGYTGDLCQYGPRRSCRGYVDGNRVSGTYQVHDSNMNPFDVFCHFDQNSTMTWTLVQSYQFQNTSFRTLSFLLDSPVNENKPRWDAYRLSKSRMQSIQDDSSQFRMTCKYDTDGMVYRDFVQATKSQVDIMIAPQKSYACAVVDAINVRGHSCSNCSIIDVLPRQQPRRRPGLAVGDWGQGLHARATDLKATTG